MVDRFIDDNKKNMIQNIIDLISFNSVSTKSNVIGKPFGEECHKALEYVLNLGKSMGFKTKNIDGYCGYIEFGSGQEMVGIIGHLDIVPADINDGWHQDPFAALIKDNKIYGRGAVDDKGPVIASLYAMKAVAENISVDKRVRLILGLNEEQNWECINYYKEHEESPTISFSPDAEFPCIYAEKEIVRLTIEHEYLLKDIEIIEMSSLDNAVNVVPQEAYVVIKLNNINDKYKYIEENNIKITDLGNSILKITAKGKQAHASTPLLGENAITKLIMYLNKMNSTEYINKLIKEGFFMVENPYYLGGEELIDETGKLTSNIGQLKYEDNKLIFKVDIRVPVKITNSYLKDNIEELKNKIDDLTYDLEIAEKSLYVPKDNYLVKTLTDTFNEETGLKKEPIAIGGGTYARAFDNCVSFGMAMPGEEMLCHQVNENINIDNLILSTKIYARAIEKLLKNKTN